jgi:dienelactone hydrolase
MDKLSLTLVVTLALLLGNHAVHSWQDGPPPTEAAARAFLGLLAKEDFAEARKEFDETMLKAMSQESLADVWKKLVDRLGPFQKLDKARQEKVGLYEVAIVTCVFAKDKIDARVAYKDKKVSGLFFVPVKSDVVYAAPSYVKKDAFRELDVTVGSGEWALKGTLSLPTGIGPFPAVVLCQGSGPQDRDETIGPNKPFKDIAWGLSSRGIAVLRFDRRAFTHGKKIADMIDKLTVKEEVIDDVYAAVALPKQRQDIDASQIFVLGHSLGAMLGPRMALGNPDIRGLILMAGPARPFGDLIVYQYEYLFSLEGPLSEKNKTELAKIKEQVARANDPKLSPEVPAKDLPLGMPARYWLSLRGDSPPDAAKKLKRPMLILQGERDYQVPLEEFQVWKKALSERKDVSFKSYPRLNHLFMEGAGTGKSQPKEYNQVGHVPMEVIDDIAGWVRRS